MSKKTTKVNEGGSNFLSLLQLAFIILKLINVINWSWWWVLSPLILIVCSYAGVVICVILVALIMILKGKIKKSNS